MIGFFEDVPRELEEAALIDGCSLTGIFFRIVLPLSKPAHRRRDVLGFIASWNNFIFVLILGGRNTVTSAMAVYSFVSFEDIKLGWTDGCCHDHHAADPGAVAGGCSATWPAG